MAIERERVPGDRIRPARRARWRRYAPALTTLVLSTALVLAVDTVAAWGQTLTLSAHASTTFAAILAVGLVCLTAALCDRPPVRWYIAGAFAVSLGANLAPPRGVGLPLAFLGLVGLLVQEVQRAFDGVTVGPQGLTIHRPLKDPLTVDHGGIEAVHTTLGSTSAGTLILETVHGTVTARDLPDVEQVQARIEARTSSFDVDEPVEAARQARERIQGLLREGSPS